MQRSTERMREQLAGAGKGFAIVVGPCRGRAVLNSSSEAVRKMTAGAGRTPPAPPTHGEPVHPGRAHVHQRCGRKQRSLRSKLDGQRPPFGTARLVILPIAAGPSKLATMSASSSTSNMRHGASLPFRVHRLHGRNAGKGEGGSAFFVVDKLQDVAGVGSPAPCRWR